MAKDLTARRKQFCLEYLKDHNGTQAAIRAGYSAKTANEQSARLLANVSVSKFIQTKQEKIENKLELTAEKILRDIEEVRRRCIEEKFQPHAALKASELQGKYKALWTDKIEHSGNPYEGWTKEQLEKRNEELDKLIKKSKGK